MSLTVRPLQSADLPAVARIHVAAFPASALTRLGTGAVHRYYEWQLLGPHDVTALGTFDGDLLAGFCFGGIFRGATTGFLQKNRAYLAWRVLTRPWLLANSLFRERLRFGRRILARKTRHVPATGIKTAPPFGILSIAVHPAFQGRGVGTALMNEAEGVARGRGFDAMDLTVDPSNTLGIDFYERRHWKKIPTSGPWKGRMWKSLEPQARSNAS